VSRLHSLTQLLQNPDPANLAILGAVLLVALGLAYMGSKLEPTVLVLAAFVLQLFSGNWNLMGIPLPLDRLVLVLALGSLVLKGPRVITERRIIFRPVHIALLTAATWAAVSAIIAGTMFSHLGFYAYLDRFGLVPFAMFTMAPLFFGTPRHRSMLLATMVGIGLYLGLTGAEEGLHIYKLLLPRYIANPNLGIHWGRARGPFLEATGDGFCIFAGAVAAVLGLSTWRGLWARRVCYLTIGLDATALFFTLTRGVWIGAFLGAAVAAVLNRKVRRILVPIGLAGLAVAGLAILASSSVRAEVLGRAESQSPVWDRQNTDLAALRIVEEHPLTGVGWENFINVSGNYMVQQPTIPISGLGIEVHNMFLSHAAELGVPGLLLWLTGFGGAVWRAFSRRWPRAPGQSAAAARAEEAAATWRRDWQLGGLAILACFFAIADLAPFSQALPNTLLWTFLGVLAMPYTSTLRSRALVRVRSLGPDDYPELRPVPRPELQPTLS
jgi:putative inorganic carbon (hco3(-)) transporter